MQNKGIKHISKLRVYKKAIEIFALTRSIASYVTNDKDVLSIHKSNTEIDKYTDSIIMNSLALAPKIAEIETEKSTPIKLRLAKSFESIVMNIDRDCTSLEETKIHGKDYLKLLKVEVKKLKLLYKNYINSIIET